MHSLILWTLQTIVATAVFLVQFPTVVTPSLDEVTEAFEVRRTTALLTSLRSPGPTCTWSRGTALQSCFLWPYFTEKALSSLSASVNSSALVKFTPSSNITPRFSVTPNYVALFTSINTRGRHTSATTSIALTSTVPPPRALVFSTRICAHMHSYQKGPSPSPTSAPITSAPQRSIRISHDSKVSSIHYSIRPNQTKQNSTQSYIQCPEPTKNSTQVSNMPIRKCFSWPVIMNTSDCRQCRGHRRPSASTSSGKASFVPMPNSRLAHKVFVTSIQRRENERVGNGRCRIESPYHHDVNRPGVVKCPKD